MSWLARLKKASVVPAPVPAEPTEPGFAGFVASPAKPSLVSSGDANAANDCAPSKDIDRSCWPYGSAMNSAEIALFQTRVHHLVTFGVSLSDAESLADRLVTRDRDRDDRHVCLECAHMRHGGQWRCTNRHMGPGARAQWGMPLVRAIAEKLQRCEGFTCVAPLRNLPIDFGEMG